MAVGILRLSLEEAYSLTLNEFNEIYAQWNELEMIRYRTNWEQTRFLAQCILTPHTGKKRLAPQDIIHFDWDTPPEDTKPCSIDDFERIKKMFDE